MNMKKFINLCLLLAVSLTASAVTPLWMRDVRISPNGEEIVFTYKGDLYKVKAQGGEAQQLTTTDAYEYCPVWSNDGKQIAFASDREGNFDVFVMSAQGGKAQRVTTHSTAEKPMAFTKNNKNIIYGALLQAPAASAVFPSYSMSQVYSVPIKGGASIQLLATPAEQICLSKEGNSFLYTDKKGGENQWRKHHTSSITRDIWLYDIDKKEHKQLIKRAGEDRNAVFARDGKTIYFLTEQFGTFNIAQFDINTPKAVKQVSHFKTHPVRFLSIDNNDQLCFTYNGEIYTQPKGKKAHKLRIELVRDDLPQIKNFSRSSGASSVAVSPNGKQVAVVVRGEVFVTATDYSTTKQITHTAAAEKQVSFSADNRSLVYTTERNGSYELCIAKIAREEDLYFSTATLIEEEILLPSTKVERSCPQFSPDGKEVAFVEDRSRLMVVNLKTKKVRQITDGSTNYSTTGNMEYEWSPDGKWFAVTFVGNQRDPYYDLGLVSAVDGGEIYNITESGYFDMQPRWVMDGNAIIFSTNRYGMRAQSSWGSLDDMMIVFLNQEAYDKYRMSKEDYELYKEFKKEQKKIKAKKEKEKNKKKKADKKKTDKKEEKKTIKIDWKNLRDRIVRLTPNSSRIASAMLDKKGEKLYYLSAFEKGYDLWELNLRKGSTRLLNKMNSSWADLVLDKDGKNLFILGSRSLKKMAMGSKSMKPISYRAKFNMDLEAERAYMFDHVVLQESKRFYNKNMHGVNWKVMAKNYRKFLTHINNNYDFADLLSELLGELNVSHTGSGYRASMQTRSVADLGFLYRWNYDKEGLLIDEVIEKGPFDIAESDVKAGDVVEKIDGVKIKKGMDYYPLLYDKRGVKTLISFYRPSTGKHWDEVIKPTSKGYINYLMYKRWIKHCAKKVEKWSNGRLGYVHIQSMSDNSFRTIYSDILGKYNKCEGIVIDTRFNGGGRLHEDIEILFSGKEYFKQVVRGKVACSMPSRRWNKPSIMIQGEANYSNAHGTPWVYKHCNLGKLVGMPVPGTMTSVNWEPLQDRSLYFGIPVIGYRLPDGSYLENSQLEPDIKVANDPNTVYKGDDKQLKAAVDELLQEIDQKK
jgi:Tol biopolymer transport system component/C-terminal processing protease CtpA/Prc